MILYLCVACVELISSPLFVYFLETTNCRRRPPPDGCERLVEVKKAATEHWSVEKVSTRHVATFCPTLKTQTTRMWANAQRHGRPAEYRWRPRFNAAKFGWRPLLECRAVTLPRRQTHWNLPGCPKLTKRSQPLVGRSSPYYGDIWRRYCCLTSFFPIVDTCLSCEDIARQSCGMVPRWQFLATFLGPTFAASRMQHIWDLHSKFALGPRHV